MWRLTRGLRDEQELLLGELKGRAFHSEVGRSKTPEVGQDYV